MNKTFAKIALWGLYIMTAPIAAVWLLGFAIYSCIYSKIEFGEFDIRGVVGAMWAGIKMGYTSCMEAIDRAFEPEGES